MQRSIIDVRILYEICGCLNSLLKFFYGIHLRVAKNSCHVSSKKEIQRLNLENGKSRYQSTTSLPNDLERCYLRTIAHLDENKEKHHRATIAHFLSYLRADCQITQVTFVVTTPLPKRTTSSNSQGISKMMCRL